MKIEVIKSWRRVVQLSATFLLGILLIVSCKKKISDIGIGSLNQSELLKAGGIDTFALTTYSELDDTVVTKNPLLSVLGSYNDPVFGKMNASIYTQIRLTSANPAFEDISRIIVDSLVLSLKYDGFTGKSDAQTFEVFELNDSIKFATDFKYTIGSTVALKSQNLVDPNFKTQKMLATAEVIVDTTISTPQLRIKLDTMLAKQFIVEANSSNGNFASQEAFNAYFKGLCIRVNNGAQSSGQGGIGYFSLVDDATRLTIYYRVRQEAPNQNILDKKQFFLKINSNSQRFTHIDFDATGTKVKAVLDQKINGQKEFYAQAFGTRAVVKLASISNLPKGTIIHKAELFLPVQYQASSAYSIGSEVTLAAKLSNAGLSLLNFGIYNDFRKGYIIDVRSFVQQVVAQKLDNTELFIAPKQFITSADRIVFNGSQTTNKLQPKLTLIYTEY